MNILFVSYLSGNKWAGPTYSVPRQIEAHSKTDNVFWYNIRIPRAAEWKARPYYHDTEEFPQKRIGALPAPFNRPDLVIVEQFYGYAESPLRDELAKGDIPYIIIPRGELTAQAQRFKRLKKLTANLLFFNRFAKNAAAIEYLTEQEKTESGPRWNKNSLVIPNGITLPEKRKTAFSAEGIKCVSIGRLNTDQKGLDLLIDACIALKVILAENKVTVDIYGPDVLGMKNGLQTSIYANGLEDIITLHDGVFDKEKEAVLLDSDVFLIPSRFEGHPMALIEAMGYGLPCIASKGSNMKKEVEEHSAGWTCGNDVHSLADAFLRLIEEKRLLAEKGNNARRLAQNYDWDSIVAAARERYMEIIKK